jgi:hypothetical protein
MHSALRHPAPKEGMTAIPPRDALLAETSWLADHLGDPDLASSIGKG